MSHWHIVLDLAGLAIGTYLSHQKCVTNKVGSSKKERKNTIQLGQPNPAAGALAAYREINWTGRA